MKSADDRMMSNTTLMLVSPLFLALLILPGCGGPKPTEADELSNFGMMYYNTQQVHQKPPQEWAPVLKLVDVPFLKNDYDRLVRFKEAGYTIVWGVNARSPDAATTILCYSSKTLREGGPVLFANGAVLNLSAAELEKALEGDPE